MQIVTKTDDLPARRSRPRGPRPGAALAVLTARLVGLVGLLGLLGLVGCAVPPARDGSSPAGATPAASDKGSPAATPAPEPAPTPEPVPAALSPQEAQRTLAGALDLLQGGQEDAAEAELRRLLQSDPNNRLAQSLLRQIKEDPFALLGRESFAYRVQPGESLSRIAQRFLGDVHMFYALARYNNIKVPKTLSGGQSIRVPGKAPPPGAAAASPAPASTPPNATLPAGAPAAGTVATPPAAAPLPPKAEPVSAPAPETAEAAAARVKRETQAKVTRLTREARAAYAKQDLDGALRNWDAVLEIDPDNRIAPLERQKVLDLKEKLRKVK